MRQLSPLEACALFSLLCCTLVVFWSRFAPFKTLVGLPLPPGPKTTWSGNVADLPRTKPWLTYAEWKHVYGIFVYRFLSIYNI
jgi:hypothetical protein